MVKLFSEKKGGGGGGDILALINLSQCFRAYAEFTVDVFFLHFSPHTYIEAYNE